MLLADWTDVMAGTGVAICTRSVVHCQMPAPLAAAYVGTTSTSSASPNEPFSCHPPALCLFYEQCECVPCFAHHLNEPDLSTTRVTTQTIKMPQLTEIEEI